MFENYEECDNFEKFYEVSPLSETEVVEAGGYYVRSEANIVPLDNNFNRLAKSIADTGLQLPIVLYKGEIIDGRRRAIACAYLGIKPRVDEIFTGIEFTDREIYDKVRAYNTRRSVNTAQNAIAAAIQVTLGKHEQQEYSVGWKFAQDYFAVGKTTFMMARYVLKHDRKNAMSMFNNGYGLILDGKPESLKAAYTRLKTIAKREELKIVASAESGDHIELIEAQAEIRQLKKKIYNLSEEIKMLKNFIKSEGKEV
jgi:hypothetical protein